MVLPSELRQTLIAVASALSQTRRPWWIISGAACALHGVAAPQVSDVDVLLDPDDMEPLLARLNLLPSPVSVDLLFRSRILACWTGNPLPVEFFADFTVCNGVAWLPVLLSTRQQVVVDSALVYIPERAELATLLRQFGRPKDLSRAELLSPSGPSPSRSESA